MSKSKLLSVISLCVLSFLFEQKSFSEIKVPLEIKKYGFPAENDWWFQFGWDLELDFKDGKTHVARTAAEPENNLVLGNLDLKPAIYLGPSVYFKAKIEIEEGAADFDEGTFNIKNLPWDSYISVGLDDPFAKPERETETYKLSTTAFFRDDDYRLEAGGLVLNLPWLYWKAAVANGLELQTKEPGEYAAFPMLHDDDQASDGDNYKEFSVGVGLKPDLLSWMDMDILGFWYHGKLAEGTDRATLISFEGVGDLLNGDNSRAGWNVDLTFWKNLIFRHQFVYGFEGQLDRFATNMEWAYKHTCKGYTWNGYTLFSMIEPIYAYSYYGIDVKSLTPSPLTWDRSMHIAGLNLEVVPTVMLRFAYTFHREHGVTEVANNDFLAQLKWSF